MSFVDRWLEEPIGAKQQREMDPRDVAVLRFAGSLLKRTLSESFVGVPLTEGCINSVGNPAEEASIQSYQQKQEKPILNSRSLSLELAKHKHRLAAQLVSFSRVIRQTSLFLFLCSFRFSFYLPTPQQKNSRSVCTFRLNPQMRNASFLTFPFVSISSHITPFLGPHTPSGIVVSIFCAIRR